MLTFVRVHGRTIHKDSLHSSMAVVTRLCSKIEPSDASIAESVESLSLLLKHDDVHVSDSVLRCFSSLSDRYMRKNIDPAPLAQHGLVDHLLSALASYSKQANNNSGVNSTQAAPVSGSAPSSTATTTTTTTSSQPPCAPSEVRNSASCSVIIGLLSSLCRGSPSITTELLYSNLLRPALENILLQKEERCCLDSLRLTDLILVVLFEGRQALPKISSIPSMPMRLFSGSRTPDADRTHRYLIECIRSKDTDALMEAIENGGVEVNFTDDVGQTLLNWSSAFGTLEMVEYLCEKGADVNKGQRSSSLHYAACFGRPQIAKVLLRYGANPELRDEEGNEELIKISHNDVFFG